MNLGPHANPGIAKLSERQRQCLELVAQNCTSKEIGRALGLSPSTVDNHIAAAMERLGTTSRVEAARFFKNSSEAKPSDSEDRSWALPPLGGQRNQTPVPLRYAQVFQVAFLSLMAITMLALIIAGVVHFSSP